MNDRAKLANALSIKANAQRKGTRLGAKTKRRQSLVTTDRKSGRSRDLRVANDNLTVFERDRSELQNMEETKLFSDRQLEQLGIVHPRSKNRELVDALRQLRTKLYSLKREGNFSVMVSSLVPRGGGSFVALNLAATIAFDKAKSSLLIDANLHDPVLHKLLRLIGRSDTHGLLEYLEAPELGIENIVSPSGIPRMRIIPMGNHDDFSNEHFTSGRYKQLMVDIQSRYDNRFVVVDGPAWGSSADARILSDICDYTVLVVPYGGVTPGTLDAAVDELDERKLAGIVINDQPAE